MKLSKLALSLSLITTSNTANAGESNKGNLNLCKEKLETCAGCHGSDGSGNGPHGIRTSKDSRWLYVALTKDNALAIVNARTLTLEKKIAVGAFPFWGAVQGNS
ncbi:hypothetical protein [Halothiobacillus sp.]|uniref:hypothetical protein n=1 Tax=Halothiobacillus sp. TaxID=1891311 RepID=UPI002634A0EF|nr:hypothetical protein [Halothiobacillus sp.]